MPTIALMGVRSLCAITVRKLRMSVVFVIESAHVDQL